MAKETKTKEIKKEENVKPDVKIGVIFNSGENNPGWNPNKTQKERIY